MPWNIWIKRLHIYAIYYLFESAQQFSSLILSKGGTKVKTKASEEEREGSWERMGKKQLMCKYVDKKMGWVEEWGGEGQGEKDE